MKRSTFCTKLVPRTSPKECQRVPKNPKECPRFCLQRKIAFSLVDICKPTHFRALEDNDLDQYTTFRDYQDINLDVKQTFMNLTITLVSKINIKIVVFIAILQ
jgi:hypothetical protein